MKKALIGILLGTLLHCGVANASTIPIVDTSNIRFRGELIHNKEMDIKVHTIRDVTEQDYKSWKEQKRKEEELQRKKKLEQERKIKLQEELENKIGKYKRSKRVNLYVTYYYAANNSLQGGVVDKKGKTLDSHSQPICALPLDVNYGDYLILDKPVVYNTNFNKATTFKNVDTGGAIKWIDNNTCKVDIYVNGCSSLKWIENNLKNKTMMGTIYYK